MFHPLSKGVNELLGVHNITVTKQLYEGQCAWVYSGERENKDEVAIKVVSIHDASVKKIRDMVDLEWKIRKEIGHRGIVKTLVTLKTEFKRWNVYIMELLHSCLMDRIKIKGKITDDQAKVWFAQISDALDFLHKKKIAHRNISPFTIMIQTEDRVCLIGLGKCVHGLESVTSRVGDIVMWSPQMFIHNAYDPFKSDVWALGYTLFLAVFGQSMWEVEDGKNIPVRQKRIPQVFRELKTRPGTSTAVDLIEFMMDLHEHRRPRMSRVVRSVWLRTTHPSSPFPDPRLPTRDLGNDINHQLGPFDDQTLPRKMQAAGYSIDRKLGEGAYGAVYHGFKGRREVAVKIIEPMKGSKRYIDRGYEQEMFVVNTFKHKNIVELIGVFREMSSKRPKVKSPSPASFVKRVFVVMELCKTDLEHEIQLHGGKLSEEAAQKYIYDAAQGLAFMHGKNCAHRDIKPANILIRINGTAVIGDYSFVRPRVGRTQMAETKIGTPDYMSPQIWLSKPTKYDPYAADVWALGITLFESISAQKMYKTTEEIKANIRNVIVKVMLAKISDESKSLLCEMLAWREKDRISIQGVLNHRWFKTQENQMKFTKYYYIDVKDKVSPKEIE